MRGYCHVKAIVICINQARQDNQGYVHQQVAEGSADLHSSHQLSALLVRQQQATPLEQQHSRAAMPLVV